jgi:hypothetical protein
MPTYQLGAKSHMIIGDIDDALRHRVQQIICFYILGFYGLLLVLKVDPLKAFFWFFGFWFSTYLIIILGVGIMPKHMLLPICLLLSVLYWFSEEEVHSRRFSYDVCDS